ncbi:MAG: aspartyl protease family protein [Thermoanaerobaculia bacterium]
MRRCPGNLVAVALCLLAAASPLVGQIAAESTPAQTLTEEQLAALRQGAAEAVLSNESVTVPLVGTPTLPLVETHIDGAGPFRLLVDLGSNVTILRRDVVDAAGIDVVLDRESSDIVRADSLTIGSVRFGDVWMGAYDELDVDGVIGYNLLDVFPFVLDLAAQKLTLGSSEVTDVDPRYAVENRLPYFPARIGDREILLNPDTGAIEEMTVPAAWEDSLPLDGEPEPGPITHNEQTGATHVRVARLATDLRVGELTLGRPLVYFNPDAEDAWIGCGLLRHYVLSIDPERGRYRLERSDHAAAVADSYSTGDRKAAASSASVAASAR